jgi:hypothetical protein
MSSPTQLNIVITQNASGTVTTSTVVIPIPAALQALDSTTPGASQTGYSAVDQLIRNIFRAGVFSAQIVTPGTGVVVNNWYPTSVIQTITWT